MNYVVGVILACMAMAIIVAMVHQAWTYSRGQQIISRRQLIMRLVLGLLLLITIGLLFAVPFVVRGGNVGLALAVYGLLLFLPVVVMVLAWLDLRELQRMRHVRQAELYRNLAQLQHELQARPPDAKKE